MLMAKQLDQLTENINNCVMGNLDNNVYVCYYCNYFVRACVCVCGRLPTHTMIKYMCAKTMRQSLMVMK